LHSLIPYLALGIYPVAFLLGFVLNPVEFLWTFRLARQRRSIDEPMPAGLRDRADSVSRYLNFVVDGLILIFVGLVSCRISVTWAAIGLRATSWEGNLLIGVASGVLLVASQRVLLSRGPIDPGSAFAYRVRRGATALWVLILMSAAFSEELWIALCLVVLRPRLHSTALSVALIMMVFAAGHYSYGFWGAVAVATKGTASALLFLHFRSLVVTFPYHFIGNLGALYWNRYWRR